MYISFSKVGGSWSPTRFAISSPRIRLVFAAAITSWRHDSHSPHLVQEDLEGHGALAIADTATVLNILGPGTALHVQHLTLGRGVELHGHQGTQVTRLVQERVVVAWEPLAGEVADVLEVLLVLAQVTVAAHPDLLTLEYRSTGKT